MAKKYVCAYMYTLLLFDTSQHNWINCKQKMFKSNLTIMVGVNFNLQSCFKTCYQYYVITKCGCADAYYPKYGEAFDYVNVSSCNSSDLTQGEFIIFIVTMCIICNI